MAAQPPTERGKQPNPRRERREKYFTECDARQILANVVDAAERAHELLGKLAPARYADPVAEEIGCAAFSILHAAVGDLITQMRLSEILSDITPEGRLELSTADDEIEQGKHKSEA